uniref:Uncharacterized protein n=1 Tax=Accipiter nisus TaxID=211598 RepID=A0A8B9NLS3_9AVES
MEILCLYCLSWVFFQVIETRSLEASYFLPETIFKDKCNLPKSLEKHEKNLFFLTNKIAESLGGSGYSVERLSVPYVPQVTALFPSGKKPHKCRHKSKDEDRLSRRKSIVDTVSIQVDILPGNNTEDKVDNTEEITFEALKKAIDNNGLEEQEKEKRRLVIEKFQKAPFEEIAAQCETKANLLHDRLAQILELTIRLTVQSQLLVDDETAPYLQHSVVIFTAAAYQPDQTTVYT